VDHRLASLRRCSTGRARGVRGSRRARCTRRRRAVRARPGLRV